MTTGVPASVLGPLRIEKELKCRTTRQSVNLSKCYVRPKTSQIVRLLHSNSQNTNNAMKCETNIKTN